MTYDPRTIAFGAELIHQPIQLQTETVQGIHNQLFQQHELSYQNFQVAQDGIHLSNPAQSPGMISMASFAPDRIILREEFRPCTVEEFATRVVNVVGASYRTLNIPMSMGQQFWVRSLINPRHVEDSRQFVSERMLAGGQESLSVFGRPLHTLGLRYTFPQTDTQTEIVNLRIEPWPQDPRSVWIEVISQFTQPISAEKLPELSNHLYSVYKFMTGPASEYISKFDTL